MLFSLTLSHLVAKFIILFSSLNYPIRSSDLRRRCRTNKSCSKTDQILPQ